MSSSPLRAVLFDIDGTLVDSNYLHIDAWARAFDEVDEAPPASEIHAAMGLDSGKLLERLLGDAADSLGDKAKELHSGFYQESTQRLHRLRGVRELLAAIRERGLRIVLASSAPQEELDILLKVLDIDDLIDETTTSSDVETAKPEPDVIETALERAGVDASEAVMVGDARWDVEAAARAGVDTIGLLTGGRSETELRDAGAVAVFRDLTDLREHLAESPIGLRAAG